MASPTPSSGKRPSLKSKVEAILYSVGSRISVQDIKRLTRRKEEEIIEALKELQQDYEQKDSSLHIINDGDNWKFSVRDPYQNVVRKLVTETELSKSVMETLAVIAFKYPIKQSDLINIRTNKAYDHLRELESAGFISRKKHGRTNLIKLTDKFFQYFDLPEEQLREQFQDFDTIAKAIEQHEEEVRQRKQTRKQQAEEESVEAKEARIQEEIDLIDEQGKKVQLEEYGPGQGKGGPSENDTQLYEQKLGDLEVFDEPGKKKGSLDDSDEASEDADGDSREGSGSGESEDSDSDESDEDSRDKGDDNGEPQDKDADQRPKGPSEEDLAVERKMHDLTTPPEEKEEEAPSPEEYKKELLEKNAKEEDLLEAELHHKNEGGDSGDSSSGDPDSDESPYLDAADDEHGKDATKDRSAGDDSDNEEDDAEGKDCP